MIMSEHERRILCVDDDEQVRGLYGRIFEDDFVVSLAGSVESASESLDSGLDVVLVNLYLDGSFGVDLLEKIKKDPTLKNVPVLVVSAMPKRDWERVCVDMGAEDYIEKPFNVGVLKKRVDEIVGRK